jgi:hypothetical protein
MKSKYLSRKFILAVIWCLIAGLAIIFNKDVLVYFASLPTFAFIIGESFVDAKSSVKQSMNVTKNIYTNSEEVKNNASAKETTERN